MIKDRIVKVRFKRNFREQPLWVFIGKVLEFNDNWIYLEGKGIVVLIGLVKPVGVDVEKRQLLIPKDNISHVRILPDDFDLEHIETDIKTANGAVRHYLKVKNGPDATLGEIGENI